jgi:hypothetical protein
MLDMAKKKPAAPPEERSPAMTYRPDRADLFPIRRSRTMAMTLILEEFLTKAGLLPDASKK